MRLGRWWIVWLACAGVVACGDDDDDDPVADAGIDASTTADMCGDIRTEPQIYYGTTEPQFVPLSAGQVMAVGSFDGCSGTAIAPTWALSAAHCGISTTDEFCVGVAPDLPNVCVPVVRAVVAPGSDMALVELAQDITVALPGLVPVAILTEEINASWIGRTAEAAGYGTTETGSDGTRLFSAEPIVMVDAEVVTIDGEGTHGACFGDSGGPLFAIANDGTVRVIGALSYGDSSCVDIDNFTRVDINRLWIESFTGPTVVDGASCEGFDEIGRCFDGRAVYCSGDALRADDCEAGTTCGWSEADGGYRCISETDPCGGVDAVGRCDGDVARWCEAGVPKSRDCGGCEQKCELLQATGGAYCVDDPCMGLDFLGRCNGNVAEWCDQGELRMRDCAADGLTCQYIDDSIGYWCA